MRDRTSAASARPARRSGRPHHQRSLVHPLAHMAPFVRKPSTRFLARDPQSASHRPGCHGNDWRPTSQLKGQLIMGSHRPIGTSHRRPTNHGARRTRSRQGLRRRQTRAHEPSFDAATEPPPPLNSPLLLPYWWGHTTAHTHTPARQKWTGDAGATDSLLQTCRWQMPCHHARSVVR